MPWIKTLPLDLNRFWEKTPTLLKFLLIIAVIMGSSYWLFSRTITSSENNNLNKIQIGIDNMYIVIDNFEKFQAYQLEYNEQVLKDINNLYYVIEELNSHTNEKFDYIIKHHDETDNELSIKMQRVNTSFEKLTRAYLDRRYPTLPTFKSIQN